MPDHGHFLEHTKPKNLKAILIAAACIAVAIAAIGIVGRVLARQGLADRTDDAAIPSVKIIRLTGAEASRALLLPGDIEAFYSAPVYARVTGYLKAWYTDIGTPVKKGQLLGEIDAPDLDQQFQQAKGNLGTAIANENIARITAKRYLALEAQNAIAIELADQQVATWKADQAATASARAIVRQYEADESFKQLIAPFDGVVTSRSTDIGALITAGTSTSTSTSTSTGTVIGSTLSTSTSMSTGTSTSASATVPLFTVSDEHRMRIYVRVPQNYSAQIKPGLVANFTVPQYPGRTFTATLATTAEAVDATSGSLLAEFQIDNTDGSLKPGEYAQVHFVLPNKPGTVVLPSSALTFRDGGMFVATVNAQSHIVMKKVTVGRDLGQTVEISNGLSRADRVVNNPPDSMRSGDLVRLDAGHAHAQS
ncbi:MAG TPA: efflux RND transporter periplasmic adaptor subunit [Rhizomicrobium sp.]|nr:efflux RND transporter periplasmic adaptor subunit [Rhizomicrobium sp.]